MGLSCCATRRLQAIATSKLKLPGRVTSWGISLALCVAVFSGGRMTWSQSSTATSTSLAISSGGSATSSVSMGSVVTLTASVQAGSTTVQKGQVSFCDASASFCTDIHLFGTVQVTSAGTATFKFRPGLGSHSYKAVFGGTTAYARSSSAPSSLTVTGTIPPLATAATVNQTGSWGNYNLSATVTETGNTAPPTGLISFLDTNHGNAVLGTGQLGAATRGVSWMTANTTASNIAGVSYQVADLNGDGIPDLFIKDYFGTYDVVLGKGDGTFTVVGSPFGPYSQTGSFVLGDFNNDGIPDVAAINSAYYAPNSTITIFLGKGDGTFTPSATSPAIGENPTAITAADVNGDGNTDLIFSQQSSSTGQIIVLLGNGDGTFTQSGSVIATSSVAQTIVAVDLNGDGKVDLVAPTYPASDPGIYLGNGDGTFTAVSNPGISQNGKIAVADVNNDGKPDLILTSSQEYLTVLLGNGDGTFTEAPSSPSTTLSMSSFQIGDFNQDGIPDIAYTVPNSTSVAVVLGNGDGTFSPTPGIISLPYDFQGAFVVADFNGDGWPDILTEDGNSRTFIDSLTVPTETASASAPISIATAGAHLVDASYQGDSNYNASASAALSLWGAPPTTVTLLTITSGGTAVTSVAPGTVITLTASVTAGGSPVTAGQVNFCDASASSCTDMHLLGTSALQSNGTAAFAFIPGPGTHSYKAMFVQSGYGLSSSSSAASLTVGPAPAPMYSDSTSLSVNGGPGDYSLTATVTGMGGSAAPTGTVSFLDTNFGNASLATATLGTATAGIGWRMPAAPSVSGNAVAEAVGDFNQDGVPDIAVLSIGNYAYSLTILTGKGDGTFTTGTPVSIGLGGQSQPQMISGDFNADGKTDLAILTWNTSDTTSYVTTVLGRGDGTFAAPQSSAAFNQGVVGGDGVPGSMVAADFNGDGRLDLAVVGDYVSPGGIAILLGNGDGTFSAGAHFAADKDFGLVATGDFNGDGIPDLVVTNYYEFGSSPTIFIGKGDGTFTAMSTSFTLDYFPTSVLVGDFDGDGVPDLAFSDLQGVEIALGKGDGTFTETSASPISVPSELYSLTMGDFNQDGKLDIVGVDNYDDRIVLLSGAGDGTFAVQATTPAVSSDWLGPFAMAAADFNEDGVPDLVMLTKNQATATILITEPTQTATATVNHIDPIGVGTHNVDASYAGDGNYASSTSAAVPLTAGLAPLVVTPAPGTYSSAQTLTITEAVPGATIYYAAYGLINTNGFIPYTGPIQLNEGGTTLIQAYATETGYQETNYFTGTYTMNLPPAPAPVLSAAAGVYADQQTVAITDTIPGATIYYTLNGSYPSTVSSIYSGPLTIAASETLSATAIAPGYSLSPEATAQYLINSSASSFLYTVAGNYSSGYSGDGGPAPLAQLYFPSGTASDSSGNLYIADTQNNVVREVAATTGIITTIAGTGTFGYSGDGGQATSAQLNLPNGVAVDSAGNLYISDSGNSVVRKVAAGTGVISTYAGSRSASTYGDNGPATNAVIGQISAIAMDAWNNLYIGSDSSYTVRKVNASTGIITTVAGNGQWGYTGDGGAAINTPIGDPSGLAADSNGNLYIVDSNNSAIRKVNPAGIISTFAGKQNAGTGSGDGGPATSAGLYYPAGLAVDSSNNVYIADRYDSAIREVSASTGIIRTVVGDGSCGPTIDGSVATSTSICYPSSVSVDKSGDIYVIDASAAVHEATAPGLPPTAMTADPVFSITGGTYPTAQTLTISDATPGAEIYITLDGSTPIPSGLGYKGPIQITGNITVKAIALAKGFLPSSPVTATYVIQSVPALVIETLAGNGTRGFSGQGGPALNAQLGNTTDVALDPSGNIYFTDTYNEVVWKVSAATGNISVAAGNGTQGSTGNGGPATSAELSFPQAIAFDTAGNLYIADAGNEEIRKVTASTGVISLVAGTGMGGTYGSNGDGGLATSARLSNPSSLAFDAAGNLLIADDGSETVRSISAATGIITTIAGNGQYALSGDGGAATSAGLGRPSAIALDGAGNLYILTANGSVVRKVAAGTGVITTVAGNGTAGASSGDGGPALSAAIYASGLAADAAGNLYLTDYLEAIRKVDATTGVISRIGGMGYPGYNGDGEAATVATLYSPEGIVLDSSGNIYFADAYNYRIRELTAPGSIPAPIFTPAQGTYAGTQNVTLTDTQSGAAIYYTTDGTAPTANSTVYSGSIAVKSSESIRAIAVSGGTSSQAASAAYVINQPVPLQITWPSPAAIVYGTALSTTQLDATATVAGTFSYSPALGATLAAGNDTLSVTFTPTDTVNYSATTASVTLQVKQATPTIAWATPAPISYGAALSTAQLDATASVPGTFSYSPALGTVVGAGNQTLTATFTPTDSVDYASSSASVTLQVKQGTPTITWPAPASITYGTALSPTQLDATASVAGTFSYSPALGIVEGAGTQTLTATFTPTDSVDYASSSASVTLQVKQATPIITWATPSAINFGTALSATQLDATASVPGTFTYSPAAGAVPTVGSDTLAATFTPTDKTDYTTATATVTLAVNPWSPVPAISSITPAISNAGGSAFTLTVDGSGFNAGSTVYWGTSALTTQVVSATQLTAQVPASDIAAAGTYKITAQTPAPGGGASNVMTYEVDSAGSASTPPAFGSTSATVTAGSTATYTVTLPSSATNVSVSCLNLPANATCSYSAGVVNIVTAATTPKGTYQITVVFTETLPGAASGFILLPLLLLPLWYWRKRLTSRGWLLAAILVMAGTATIVATGCGGGSSSSGSGGGGGGGTTPQTHQATSSGAVMLTVQ